MAPVYMLVPYVKPGSPLLCHLPEARRAAEYAHAVVLNAPSVVR